MPFLGSVEGWFGRHRGVLLVIDGSKSSGVPGRSPQGSQDWVCSSVFAFQFFLLHPASLKWSEYGVLLSLAQHFSSIYWAACHCLISRGNLLVAEVVSRFDSAKKFLRKLERMGFTALSQVRLNLQTADRNDFLARVISSLCVGPSLCQSTGEYPLLPNCSSPFAFVFNVARIHAFLTNKWDLQWTRKRQWNSAVETTPNFVSLQDSQNKMFLWFEFKKTGELKEKLPELELAPCLYKKRWHLILLVPRSLWDFKNFPIKLERNFNCVYFIFDTNLQQWIFYIWGSLKLSWIIAENLR